MIAPVPAPTPPLLPTPTPARTPTRADPALQERFLTALAAKLTVADEAIAKMVADSSPVGPTWDVHFRTLATALQYARDEFVVAKPDAGELAAKLGAGVLRLAEASGNMAVSGRQRATLAKSWSTYLDPIIADAIAAAALLAPAKGIPQVGSPREVSSVSE